MVAIQQVIGHLRTSVTSQCQKRVMLGIAEGKCDDVVRDVGG
jgi:hypothetical protein